MIDPIEAVGRAMYDIGPYAAYPEMSMRKYYEHLARAAITALRDCGVTEGMLLAYFEAPPDEADLLAGYSDTDYLRACAKAEFRAMLDAALEGK